ncbi:MAG: FAD binding domain-containing protein, partial [Dehalococcoidia bacterium]
DPGTLLTCLESELVLQRGDQERVVPLNSFLVDAYTTCREDDEILVEIRVPPPPPRSQIAYQTFRFYERPSANVAVLVSRNEDGEHIDELRAVVGAVPPIPSRLTVVEVAAQNLGIDSVAEVVDQVSTEAMRDVEIFSETHGSEGYQCNLVRVLLRRALADTLGTV